MAIKFIEITYEKLNNNKTNNARVEIAVDSAADLVTAHKGITFTQGSIAWDVSTGDFYGLDSSGTWHKQGGGDDSAETSDVQQSNSAPQNLSLNSGLNRPVTLNEPKNVIMPTEDEKADASDSEDVAEGIKEELEETEKQTEDISEEETEDEPETVEKEPEVEEAVEGEPAEDVPDIDSGNIEETEKQSEEDVR